MPVIAALLRRGPAQLPLTLTHTGKACPSARIGGDFPKIAGYAQLHVHRRAVLSTLPVATRRALGCISATTGHISGASEWEVHATHQEGGQMQAQPTNRLDEVLVSGDCFEATLGLNIPHLNRLHNAIMARMRRGTHAYVYVHVYVYAHTYLRTNTHKGTSAWQRTLSSLQLSRYFPPG